MKVSNAVVWSTIFVSMLCVAVVLIYFFILVMKAMFS
jgi:hypothetical protein